MDGQTPHQETPSDTPRDRPFDPWRVPATPKAQDLVAEAVRRVEGYEHHCRPRKRARKTHDQETLRATVAALLSDAALHHLSGHRGRIAITRSKQQLAKRSRYQPPALTNKLPHVLDAMASRELGLLDMRLGWHDLDPRPDRERFRRTTIIAGPVLRSWAERHGLSCDDFSRAAGEETILLKGMKPKRGVDAPPHKEPRAPLIEYDDRSSEHPAHRMRAEMRDINEWIEKADLAFAEGTPEEIRGRYDLTQRRLRRHFTQASFESGGRLFGGVWQTIERKHRPWLRLNGEQTVTLDYQAMFVNLAYARMGVAPKGDPYMIPRWHAYRRGVQKLMQATLFSHRPEGRLPRGTRKHLPKEATRAELMDAILRHHGPIRDLLCFEVGHHLMFDESEIIVAALLRLRDLGVHALPLHDALCVPRSARAIAERVMGETYEARTGGTIKVCAAEAEGPDEEEGTV